MKVIKEVLIMPEYIERESALQVVSDVMSDCKVLHKHRALNRNLKQITTVDVVEVVRCKECTFGRNNYLINGLCLCERPIYVNGGTEEKPKNELLSSEDFCSYGERKGD